MKIIQFYRYPVTDGDGQPHVLITPFRMQADDPVDQYQLRAEAGMLLTDGTEVCIVKNVLPAALSDWSEVPADPDAAGIAEEGAV